MKTLAMCCVVGLVASAALAMESQTFDTAATAAADGWAEYRCREGGMNYGWSDTMNASGDGGEAGGKFIRADWASYYADLTLGGVQTLEDDISGTGKLYLDEDIDPAVGDPPNFDKYEGNARIGHIDENGDSTYAANFMGFVIDEPRWDPGINLFRVRGKVTLADGASTTLAVIWTSSEQQNTFSYAYDPSAGDYGRFSIEVLAPDDSVIGSDSFDLTEAQRQAGISLDAFGIGFPNAGRVEQGFAHIWTDNVSYTPEPATLSLLGVSALWLLRRKK